MTKWTPALLALCLCAVVFGMRPASGQPTSGAQPALVEFVTAPAHGVVLGRAEAANLLRPCSREFPEGMSGYWRPTPEDLADLEERLPSLLLDEIPLYERSGGARSIRIYRQYVGMFRGGTKVIYVNGMPADAVERNLNDWLKGAMLVCDGGSLFFGVVYTPATKTFDSFAGNGGL